MTGERYTHDPETHNRRSAARVVPWLVDRYAPRTVLDVGCGLGSWAAVFADLGCEVLGLDGEEVSDQLLEIPRERFRVVDFEEPVEPPGRYDLALCLEVAEHLSDSAGQRLVQFLTAASDLILFSAAVPGQGGMNHLNERWPHYWQDLFADRGYEFEDEIRWRFWNDEEVEWWYRQNMFIVRRGGDPSPPVPAVTHPRLLEQTLGEANRAVNDFNYGRVPLRTGAIVFARAARNALRNRLGR